jgi:cytochrome c1
MKRAVAFILLAGCVSVPHLTPGQLAWATAKWPDAQGAELEQGRSIYVTRCSSCHSAPAPQEVMEQKDDDMVKEMVERAKLSPQEQQAVMRFLEAATSPGKAGVAQR